MGGWGGGIPSYNVQIHRGGKGGVRGAPTAQHSQSLGHRGWGGMWKGGGASTVCESDSLERAQKGSFLRVQHSQSLAHSC